VAANRTVAGFNELTDLLIFKVEQLPAFVNGATFLQAARRAVHFVFDVDDEGKHHRNQQVRLVLQAPSSRTIKRASSVSDGSSLLKYSP
jgi:hypothetical protein